MNIDRGRIGGLGATPSSNPAGTWSIVDRMPTRIRRGTRADTVIEFFRSAGRAQDHEHRCGQIAERLI
jgi:hypothetical protein